MPKVGDRVIVEASKVGQQRREGTLIGTVGPLINVRWNDGAVSLFKPAAGSVSFEPATSRGSKDGARRRAKAPAAKVKRTPPKSKGSAKKPAARSKR